MTYQKPGFYEVPAGLLVPEWCDRIRQSESWERDLPATLDGLGRGGRRVSSIGIEDVVALQGVGVFAAGLPAHRALVHVLLRFLHAIGVIDRYPRVIGYSATPYLTLDECIDRMLTTYVRWPSMDSLGGATAFNVEALKSIFSTVIRELGFQKVLRDGFRDRLRLKLGAIAFKIATGQAIDQAERSFFVAFGDPSEEMGWTREEASTRQMGSGKRPPIAVAENGDPLVMEAWQLFKASTEQGPFLRFMTLKSNTNLENLVYWYGPNQAALSYGLGYMFSYGKHFVEPRIREGVVLPWSPSDQLTAARERNVAFKFDDSKSIMRNPITAMVDGVLPPDPCFDLPDVNIHVAIDGGDIAGTEYSYYSSWRERTVSTIHAANPQTLLNDLALTRDSVGEGLSTGHSIQDWDLIDLAASEKFLRGQKPWKPNYDERIVLPGLLGAANRDVRLATVNTEQLYKRHGTTMFPPAFREYVMAPMSWLHTQDTEAEEYIAARLGLTWEEKQQALRTIRISHNYAKLARLLGEKQLPMPEGRMQALCRAILGG